MIKILTVLENECSLNRSLKNEFGLSFFIEKDKKSILFDAGSNDVTVKNVQACNVDIDKIEYTVLSHSHFDHSGGYKFFLNKGLKSPVITGVNFWHEKYAQDEIKFTYLGCGFKAQLLQECGITQHICTDTLEIFQGCTVVSNFDRNNVLEMVPKRFKKMCNGQMVQDDFSDEVCLAMDSTKGLIVIVGCSHPGLLNMLETVSKKLNRNIHAVIGGAHLKDANEERIKITLEKMKQLGVKFLGLNHCTGENAEKFFKEYGENMQISVMHTGDCLLFD